MKLIDFKEEHPSNTFNKLLIFFVLNLERSIEVNEEQPEKRYVMTLNLPELKSGSLIFFKEKQLMNILWIFVTFWVLKLDISIDVNRLQLENIWLIVFTFFVSKFDKLIDVNDEQLENIYSIVVTFWVFIFDKLIEVNEEHS